MVEHMKIMGLQWALHNNKKKKPQNSGGEKLIHKNQEWLQWWWSLVFVQWKTLRNHRK